MSGANWNNSSIAGVWALNCNNVRGNSNDNYGFRSDSKPRITQVKCGIKGGAFLHLVRTFAKSAGRPFSSRCHVALERLGAIL